MVLMSVSILDSLTPGGLHLVSREGRRTRPWVTNVHGDGNLEQVHIFLVRPLLQGSPMPRFESNQMRAVLGLVLPDSSPSRVPKRSARVHAWCWGHTLLLHGAQVSKIQNKIVWRSSHELPAESRRRTRMPTEALETRRLPSDRVSRQVDELVGILNGSNVSSATEVVVAPPAVYLQGVSSKLRGDVKVRNRNVPPR